MRRIVLAMLAAVVAAPLALAQLAPLPAHAQSASYRIQPGDQLAVTVLEDDTLNRQVLVLPDGRISVPLAGSVRASGQTVESVEKTIADRLASNFAVRPSVFVSVTGVIEEEETFPIYVLGQVGAPGQVEVEVGTTLLQADRAFRRARPLRRHQAHPAAPHRHLDRPGAALSLQLQGRRARRGHPVDDHAARRRRHHRSRT